LELFGSSVKTASDPVTGMPAIAVAAIVTVTLIVPARAWGHRQGCGTESEPGADLR
jgi:hypothetical protein